MLTKGKKAILSGADVCICILSPKVRALSNSKSCFLGLRVRYHLQLWEGVFHAWRVASWGRGARNQQEECSQSHCRPRFTSRGQLNFSSFDWCLFHIPSMLSGVGLSGQMCYPLLCFIKVSCFIGTAFELWAVSSSGFTDICCTLLVAWKIFGFWQRSFSQSPVNKRLEFPFWTSSHLNVTHQSSLHFLNSRLVFEKLFLRTVRYFLSVDFVFDLVPTLSTNDRSCMLCFWWHETNIVKTSFRVKTTLFVKPAFFFFWLYQSSVCHFS